ncbi:MAG: hypothetical protein KGZ83_16350, partial [Sulfuricella sp.]|nr:hypothetical protein [Sulfuricella sp.]
MGSQIDFNLSEKVFDGIRDKITQYTIDLINLSPTLKAQLHAYDAEGKQLVIDEALGTGAQYKPANNEIAFGPEFFAESDRLGWGERNVVGALAHELGHYIDRSNIPGMGDKNGFDFLVRWNRGEAFAAANNYVIYREILDGYNYRLALGETVLPLSIGGIRAATISTGMANENILGSLDAQFAGRLYTGELGTDEVRATALKQYSDYPLTASPARDLSTTYLKTGLCYYFNQASTEQCKLDAPFDAKLVSYVCDKASIDAGGTPTRLELTFDNSAAHAQNAALPATFTCKLERLADQSIQATFVCDNGIVLKGIEFTNGTNKLEKLSTGADAPVFSMTWKDGTATSSDNTPSYVEVKTGTGQSFLTNTATNLQNIAATEGISVADLLAVNPGLSTEMSIDPRTVINLPTSTSSTPGSTGTSSSGTPTTTSTTPTDVQALAAWVTFLQAMRTGTPLQKVTSGAQLVATYNRNDLPLNGVGSGLSAAGSLLAMLRYYQNRDALGTLAAGSQFISSAAQAYASLGYSNAESAQDALKLAFEDNAPALEALGNIAAVANIINCIAHDDPKGAILSAITAINPPVGIILSVLVSFIDSNDPPGGRSTFQWDTNFQWDTGDLNSYPEDGRNSNGLGLHSENAGDLYSKFWDNFLKPAFEKAKAEGEHIGVIPERIPALHYIGKDDTFKLCPYILNQDGSIFIPSDAPTYDTKGNRIGVEVGSEAYFQSLPLALADATIKNGAFAPWWEVKTAYEQHQKIQKYPENPGKAMGEVDPAVMQSHPPYASASDSSFTFRPIVIDLDGNGIHVIGKDTPGNHATFDVDDSGFLRKSDWYGPGDGFLVLDRNGNGRIDSGSELFSNPYAADGKKGVHSLGWLDADLSGTIDSNDPVFPYLWVWEDTNSNGVFDAGDNKKSLSEVTGVTGITGINDTAATGTGAIASPSLQVDSLGVFAIPIASQYDPTLAASVYTAYSDGMTGVVVNSLLDESTGGRSVEGAKEGIPVAIPTSLLDPSGSITAWGITKDASVFTYGDLTVFSPGKDFNYDKDGLASFSYNVSGTSKTIDIQFAPVNDAPVITGQGSPLPIYGYKERYENGKVTGYQILHQQQNASTGVDQYGNSLTTTGPLADAAGNTLVDYNSGQFQIEDVDSDRNTMTFTLTGAAHHASVTLDEKSGSGIWSIRPDTPVTDTAPGTADAFRVQAKDSGGAIGSYVVKFTPQEVVVPPTPEAATGRKLSVPPKGFFPGPDGVTPTQNPFVYRSRLLAGKSPAALGDIVTSVAYLYSDDHLTLTVLGKDDSGTVTERETLTLEDKGIVKDVLEIGLTSDTAQPAKASMTTETDTVHGGAQTDNWSFADGSLRGSDTYQANGSHSGILIQNIKNPDGSTVTIQTTNDEDARGTTTTVATRTTHADGTITETPATTTTTPPTGSGTTPTAPQPTVPLPTTTPPQSPMPVRTVSDAVNSFQQHVSGIVFRIDKDGTTHLTYTNQDGTTNSLDAGADGRISASRTPKDGAKATLNYDPTQPGQASGSYVLPSSALAPTGPDSFDLGGGVSVTQNADGTSQYSVPTPGGGTTAIQVDGSGTHIKVYNAGGTLVSQATTHYDPSGQYVYTPEPLPAPPAPPASSSSGSSPTDSGS